MVLKKPAEMSQKSTDITWHAGSVTPADRHKITGNQPCVVWLTGLSGCGKSTIAMALESALIRAAHLAFVLDGDNLRHGLNRDLGFSEADRTENIRRVGEVAKLLADAHIIAICSFISPYRADRAGVRRRIEPSAFIEVFVDAPLSVCEARDPKDLYKKARANIAAGNAMSFTGLDAPYEAPSNPEVHLKTAEQSVEASVAAIMSVLVDRRVISGAGA